MKIVKLKKDERKLLGKRKTGFVLSSCSICGTKYIQEVGIDDKWGDEFCCCSGGISVEFYPSNSKKLLTAEQIEKLLGE